MDPEGNFAGTLLLFPDGDPHSFALRSFVMSLALADSFETLFPHKVTCQLKWPNDALLNGAKVAGILLETVALSAGQMALAIGVGVNLKNAPEASNLENRALPPASIYGLTGQVITPEAFLPTLASAFAVREAQFDAYGFDPIRRSHKILSRRPTMVRCCTRLHCYGMIRKLDHILNLQTSRVIKASVI